MRNPRVTAFDECGYALALSIGLMREDSFVERLARERAGKQPKQGRGW